MDPVFDLISANRSVPAGWGFPVAPGAAGVLRAETPEVAKLRSILLPLSDTEGLAQLYRWHYALLRARKHVWRSLSTGEGSYDPSAVFKGQLVIQNERVTAGSNGYLTVGWQFAGETDALEGVLERVSDTQVRLKLGTYEKVLPISISEGVATIRWPEFMKLSGGLYLDESEFVNTWSRSVLIRVAGFDAAVMVDNIERANLSNAFLAAGLLDSWHALPYPVDRIALSWLLLAMSDKPNT